MESWVLGIVGSVIVVAVGGAVALVVNHEKRIASIETTLHSQLGLLQRLDIQFGSLSGRLDHIHTGLIRVETVLSERDKT